MGKWCAFNFIHFSVFILCNPLSHLILPEKLSLFSDLYFLSFQFSPAKSCLNPVLWYLLISLTLFLVAPTHCHKFMHYFRPSESLECDLESLVIPKAWSNHFICRSLSFILKAYLSFNHACSMDLIFMTCQPFQLNMMKTKVLVLLISRLQAICQPHQVILLPLSKLPVTCLLWINL